MQFIYEGKWDEVRKDGEEELSCLTRKNICKKWTIIPPSLPLKKKGKDRQAKRKMLKKKYKIKKISDRLSSTHI